MSNYTIVIGAIASFITSVVLGSYGVPQLTRLVISVLCGCGVTLIYYYLFDREEAQ